MAELTTDDVEKMQEPLTRVDLVRILRLVAEKLEEPNSLLAMILQSTLEDGGTRKQLREELEKELSSCTTKELHAMKRGLSHARGFAYDEPE